MKMILFCAAPSPPRPPPPPPLHPSNKAISPHNENALHSTVRVQSNGSNFEAKTQHPWLPTFKLCSCGRRHFLEAVTSAFFPICPSYASTTPQSFSYVDTLNKVHPPRPDWYEELYASTLNSAMDFYEAEVAGYKSQLFDKLRGKATKVLEVGIGTGPNLHYYAGADADADLQVFGVDPNRKMEKYARDAAVAARLPLQNFNFIPAVAESLPLSDASVDAVVGTLVLCSVKDVNMALKEVKRVLKPGGIYLFLEHVAAKDGTAIKLLQRVFDPLQQALADGCHLTRETGKDISAAGFSNVESSMVSIPNLLILSPHLYGIAYK